MSEVKNQTNEISISKEKINSFKQALKNKSTTVLDIFKEINSDNTE